MSEQKDFDVLKNMMESVLQENLTKSENLILDEMERTREILDRRIEKVQNNMEEIRQYYRIARLENDNTALLLKMIDELSKRVEEPEKRTA